MSNYITTNKNPEYKTNYTLTEEAKFELMACPIYRLYFSKEEPFVDHFNGLITLAASFGIEFPKNNKKDGCLIVLSGLLDELAMNSYMTGDHDAAREITARFIADHHKTLTFSVPSNTKWEKFMELIDDIERKYVDIMNILISNQHWPVECSRIEPKDAAPLQLAQTLSEISDDDPRFEDDKKYDDQDINEDVAEPIKIEDDSNLEVINKPKMTVLKTFQHIHGNNLKKKNASYYENMVLVFDVLMDSKRGSDEILPRVQAYLSNDVEAAIFLIENRQTVISELNDALLEDKNPKSGSKNNKYASVSNNLTVTVKKKGKKAKPEIKNKYQILKVLGLSEDAIMNEMLEETKKKAMANFDR